MPNTGTHDGNIVKGRWTQSEILAKARRRKVPGLCVLFRRSSLYQLVCQSLHRQWRIPLTPVMDEDIGLASFVDSPPHEVNNRCLHLAFH